MFRPHILCIDKPDLWGWKEIHCSSLIVTFINSILLKYITLYATPAVIEKSTKNAFCASGKHANKYNF